MEIKKAVAEMGNSLQGLEDRIAQISEKVEQKGRHGVGGAAWNQYHDQLFVYQGTWEN